MMVVMVVMPAPASPVMVMMVVVIPELCFPYRRLALGGRLRLIGLRFGLLLK